MNSKDIGNGTGLFYIPALPPRSETTITTDVTSLLAPHNTATVYVRSEMTTGLHGIESLSLAYIFYAISLIFNVLYVIYKDWDLSTGKYILFVVDIFAGLMIGFSLLHYVIT